MLLTFGPFELDLAACELRRSGQPVPLQPRVFDVIRYLAENRGRLVDKQELIDALWGGQQLSEVVLPWTISHARKALGEQAGRHRWIETVRRRGYRFIGDVRVADLDETANATEHELASRATVATEPFVGRDAILDSLIGNLNRAHAGRGGLYVLAGEPGIGKTRCANELALEARRRGFSVWTGRCLDSELAPPFWPFIQVLRELTRDPTIANAVRGEAAALQSALAPTPPGRVPALRDQNEGGFWLLDAIASCLRQSAGSRTRVIVLDDLHWADQSSLQALAILVPLLSSTRMLVLATTRDTRMTESRGNVQIPRIGPAETYVLAGLQPMDVERFLATALGLGPAAELRDRVHERTAGNPLFLQEVTRVLVAIRQKEGSVRTHDVQLPEAAKESLSQRFRALDDATRAVLDAASVLGNDFELPLLLKIVEASRERVLRGLEEALAGRILATRADASRYGFVHPLLREVLYAELPVRARMRLHARCGLALETQGSVDQRLQELAYHFHHACAEGHHERALRYGQEAGHQALAAYAYREAARNFDWAIEALSQRNEPEERRTRCELMLRSAGALSSAGERRECRRRAKRAIELAGQDGHADLMIQGVRLLRPSLTIAAVPDETAIKTLESALSLLSASEVSLRAQALSQLACLPPYSWSIERSGQASEEALSLAQQVDDPSITLDALGARLRALSGPSTIHAQLETADEMLRLDPRRASSRRADAQIARYHALLRLGQVSAADRALADLGAIGHELRVAEWIWHHDRFVAQRALSAGRLDEARREFDRLWLESQRLRLPYGAMYYGAQLNALHKERTGKRHCAEGQNTTPDKWTWAREIPAWRSERLLLAIEVGDLAFARGELRALTNNQLAAVVRDSSCLFTFAKLSLGAIALADIDAARSLFSAMQPFAKLVALGDLSFSMGPVSHYLGVLSHYLGDARAARKYLQHGLGLAAEIGDELQGQHCRLALARLLSQGRSDADRTQAAQYAAEVARAAQSSGRAPLLAAAEALQRELRAVHKR